MTCTHTYAYMNTTYTNTYLYCMYFSFYSGEIGFNYIEHINMSEILIFTHPLSCRRIESLKFHGDIFMNITMRICYTVLFNTDDHLILMII